MKKILMLVAIIVFALILQGCAEGKKEKIVTCKLEENNVAYGYKLSSVYKAYSDGKIVKKVETTEIATSDNESVLNYFENYINTLYGKMNDAYGGYDYTVTNENGKVTSITKIDYTSLNREQFIKDQPSMKKYMNDDNMITLEGIISMYETIGATCEE